MEAYAGISGLVRGVSPNEKERPEVFLLHKDGKIAARQKTANGSFSMQFLQPADYLLRVECKGYQTQESMLKLGPGQWRSLELVLSPVLPSAIKGKVCKAAGGICGAEVEAFAKGKKVKTASLKDGKFFLGPAYPGVWEVTVSFERRRWQFGAVELLPGEILEKDLLLN